MQQDDYGIENTGAGFDFGDDTDDIDYLMAEASEGESDDDDAYSHELLKNISNTENHQQKPAPREEQPSTPTRVEHPVEEHVLSEPTEEEFESFDTDDFTDNAPTFNNDEEFSQQEDNISYQQPHYENIPQREEKAEPVEQFVSQPVQQNNVPEHRPQRMNIRTENQEIIDAKTIIRVLDVYRELNDSSKNIVAQFIYHDSNVDIKDEATLVIKAINSDTMFNRVMSALRESASESDRLERVFYILQLEQNLLFELGEMVQSISDVQLAEKHDKIKYAKELEKAINGLDPKIIQYVADTESILAAAEQSE